MSLNFYLNSLLHAEGNTALGGVSAVADGLSYHDSIEKEFDLNAHMFSQMYLSGADENGALAPQRILKFKTSSDAVVDATKTHTIAVWSADIDQNVIEINQETDMMAVGDFVELAGTIPAGARITYVGTWNDPNPPYNPHITLDKNLTAAIGPSVTHDTDGVLAIGATTLVLDNTALLTYPVLVGHGIFGDGIPTGTTVTAVAGVHNENITIDNALTAEIPSGTTLSFGYSLTVKGHKATNELKVTLEKTLKEEQEGTWNRTNHKALTAAECRAAMEAAFIAGTLGDYSLVTEDPQNDGNLVDTNTFTTVAVAGVTAGAALPFGGLYAKTTAVQNAPFEVVTGLLDIELTSGAYKGPWRLEYVDDTASVNAGGFDATVTYNSGDPTMAGNYTLDVKDVGFAYADNTHISFAVDNQQKTTLTAATTFTAATAIGGYELHSSNETKAKVTNGASVAAQANITLVNITDLEVDMLVSGHAGIPAGTTLQGIDNANAVITLSADLTQEIPDTTTLYFNTSRFELRFQNPAVTGLTPTAAVSGNNWFDVSQADAAKVSVGMTIASSLTDGQTGQSTVPADAVVSAVANNPNSNNWMITFTSALGQSLSLSTVGLVNSFLQNNHLTFTLPTVDPNVGFNCTIDGNTRLLDNVDAYNTELGYGKFTFTTEFIPNMGMMVAGEAIGFASAPVAANKILAVTNASDLMVGMAVTGHAGVFGRTIASIAANNVTLNADVTEDVPFELPSATQALWEGVTSSAAVSVAGQATITLADETNMANVDAGDYAELAGIIPAGAKITSKDDGAKTITLDQNLAADLPANTGFVLKPTEYPELTFTAPPINRGKAVYAAGYWSFNATGIVAGALSEFKWPAAMGDSFSKSESFDKSGTVVYKANPILGGVLATNPVTNSKTGSLNNSTSSITMDATSAYANQIEARASAETILANAARVVAEGGVKVGSTEWVALAGQDAIRADIYYGIKHKTTQAFNAAAGDGSYTPVNGNGLLGKSDRNGDDHAAAKKTLIDALLADTAAEDKMWESMLAQLALSSINKYVPNVDYSATNLIDFGSATPVMSTNSTMTTSTLARGLSDSYLGYVTQGGEASTFSEMIRTIQDIADTDATKELGKTLAGSGRHGPKIDDGADAANGKHLVDLQDGDKVHLTIQIEITDADSHLEGGDSLKPNFLCFPDATDNAAEESADMLNTDIESGTAGYARTANGSTAESVNNLIRVKKADTSVVGRIARPEANGKAALRLRIVCKHKDD